MDTVSIRQLQHYLYCPHRWGLISIDCAWAENYFVVKADLLHERVHSDGHYVSRGKKVYTNVDVWCDELGISGKTDCLEFSGNTVTIVEYKPSSPADKPFNEDDAIQVYAQKVCVDSIFHCDSKAVIYYNDTKKRVSLPFEENGTHYRELLEEILRDIREYSEKGVIPVIRTGQKCSGCSMKELCMPSSAKKKKEDSVRAKIQKSIEG